MSMIETDGPYAGYPCYSTEHSHHKVIFTSVIGPCWVWRPRTVNALAPQKTNSVSAFFYSKDCLCFRDSVIPFTGSRSYRVGSTTNWWRRASLSTSQTVTFIKEGVKQVRASFCGHFVSMSSGPHDVPFDDSEKSLIRTVLLS